MLTLALLAFAPSANAAANRPDLTSAITQSTVPYVYATARYTVTVSNVGRATASSPQVVIQLPVTHGSTVGVLGTVSGKSTGCVQSGTRITCTMSSITKGNSGSVYVDIAYPETTSALTMTAAPTTSTTESSTTNNNSSYVALVNNYTVAFTAPHDFTNDHCTGTSLTSYFECTSGSVSTHESTFNLDGSISFTAEPTYSGTWSQPTSDSLVFEYYDETGAIVAEFEGYGTSATCWEGVTTFPSSTYVAPYHVCVK